MYTAQYNPPANINHVEYRWKDKIVFYLYSLYFILNPFYFWKSGLPQIADFIMVLLMIVYITNSGLKISFNSKSAGFLKTGLFFAIWVIIVNLSWSLFLQSDSFIFPTLFYVYNFLVATLVVSLHSQYKEKIIEITYKAVLISVIIQIANFFISGGFAGRRMTASFNNPNQLGYYSLLIISFLIFSSYHKKISMKWFIVGLISSTVLSFASLSKAAIVSFIGLITFFLFSKNQNKRFKRNFIITVLLIFLIIGIVYNTTEIIQDNPLINSVQKRLQSIGNDSDDSLEGRGYDRIFEYPEYWLFGAGEGEFTRFKNQRMEFHSTLGNIQVSYGLVGTVLFIIFMLLALKNDNCKSWYILLSLMTYGLTHNGIRNSLLWILLALMVSYQKIPHKEKEQANNFKLI